MIFFNADVERIPFHMSYVFDDPDDVYWAHEYLLKEIIDEHVPVKERRCRPNKPPFMNSDLRKAIYTKRMLRNKYIKCRSPRNWDNYRKQRNLVTKLKRQSLRCYFFERCHRGPRSKDFWPTIKPFLYKKGSKDDPTILLNEDGKIISDQKDVCNVFNEFFVNVAKDTVRLILTLTILFYSILQIFNSILFYSVFSILYSILSCCKILYYALFCILFYSILSCYSILFCFLFFQFYHANSQIL